MKTVSTITRRPIYESLEHRRLLALDPTPLEQEMIQLTNRFRSDPANEYGRLIKVDAPIQSPDAEVTSNLTYFKVDSSMLKSELSRLSPSPPVAWNEIMQNLATTQNGTMISKNSQEHYPGLATKLNAMGVPIEAGTSQNAFYNNLGVGKTPFFVHSAYVIDWGTGGSGGMQPDRGHRSNMLNALYNQTASAITAQPSSLANTQFFAKVSSAQKMAVGAVFEDKNKSGWYEAGEGVGGVQIVFEGTAGRFATASMTAGGYQMVLPAGSYTVTATGGSLKHAITLPNLTINSTNVWQNLIYDPTSIPPDSREPNNSLAAARALIGRDQTLNSLSIHTGDVDYFKFTADGTGSATIDLRFNNANGNIDLRLLDASGSQIAAAITSAAPESLTANLVRGQSYFVQVFSNSNATNSDYTLQLNLPEPAAPMAVADRGQTAQGAGPLTLSILANDTDADSSPNALTPVLQSSGIGTFSITNDKALTYLPVENYSGIDRATYQVVDDQGLSSRAATIEVMVLNFASPTPWRNARGQYDANDDGTVTPLDALLIINALVANPNRLLPKTLAESGKFSAFIDVSGSNQLEPLDALLVINELNRKRRGSGEGEAIAAQDMAFQQMYADSEDRFELELRKKKRL